MNKPKTCRFGPFVNVPRDLISLSGFSCPCCSNPVRKLSQPTESVFVVVLYSCQCGTVIVWQDENQPSDQNWKQNIDLMQSQNAQVVIFNGNKPAGPALSGLN